MTADTLAPWDGVPVNPERGNTWHWVQHTNGEVVPRWWSCSYWQAVGGYGANVYPHEAAKAWSRYLGPCLTPSEVASARAEAFAAGAKEMREMADHAARAVPIPDDACATEAHGRISASLGAALAIRALPLPTDAQAAIERVREDEREACVFIVDSTPTTDQRAAQPKPSDEPREECSRCRFWLKGSGQLGADAGDDYGVCARHAPTPRLMADPRENMGDDAYMALWPETASQEWCGEWKLAATIERAAGGGA